MVTRILTTAFVICAMALFATGCNKSRCEDICSAADDCEPLPGSVDDCTEDCLDAIDDEGDDCEDAFKDLHECLGDEPNCADYDDCMEEATEAIIECEYSPWEG